MKNPNKICKGYDYYYPGNSDVDIIGVNHYQSHGPIVNVQNQISSIHPSPGANTTSLTVTLVTPPVAGNLLLMTATSISPTQWTAPPGWTSALSYATHMIMWKAATVGDPMIYTLNGIGDGEWALSVKEWAGFPANAISVDLLATPPTDTIHSIAANGPNIDPISSYEWDETNTPPLDEEDDYDEYIESES